MEIMSILKRWTKNSDQLQSQFSDESKSHWSLVNGKKVGSTNLEDKSLM